MKLTILIPKYLEPDDLYESAIKRFTDFFHKNSITDLHFIISQNGPAPKSEKLSKLKNTTYLICKESGLGYAYRQALPYLKSDWTYITSAEIPFGFSDLENMLKMRNDWDVILGSKLHKRANYHAPYVRKILSFASLFTTRLFLPDFPVRDANGSIFFRSNMSEFIEKSLAYDFFITPEFAYRAHRAGHRVTEVPVKYAVDKNVNTSVRLFRTSMNNFRHLFGLFAQRILGTL